MFKKATVLFFFSAFLFLRPAFCGSEAVEYLCDFGIAAYKSGNYNDALSEFKKALLVDPNNQTAQTYMNLIFQNQMDSDPSMPRSSEAKPIESKKEVVVLPIVAEPQKATGGTREEAMNKALMGSGSPDWQKTITQEPMPQEVAEASGEEKFRPEEALIKVGPVAITGEVQARIGIDSDGNFFWKRANWDLNEKNWRTISDAGLNRKENTYDPRIYDRLALNLDTDAGEGFNFHTNLMFDPWSYTGKSPRVVLKGSNGDVLHLNLKYWSNSGYTINETYLTSENGEMVNVPEMKVVNGKTEGNVRSVTASGNVFIFPEIKIERQAMRPARELWVDYKQENLYIKAYPIAYENQALNFDDPLRLSNNRIWWEDSPWIRAWKQGTLNRGLNPVDFTKGYWDNSLSFFARDSEGRRLVGLRGFSANFYPMENTSIETSVATPMSPWQDYSDMDNFISATRIKNSPVENLKLGFSGTTRMGFNLENDNKVDARNYVLAGDVSYELLDGLLASAEFAQSHSKYDLSQSNYETQTNGNAYYFSLIGRFPFDKIINTKFGYDGIQPQEFERHFTKFRFFASRMDDSFDQPLSSYVETRDDEWWGRHLHFRTPFKNYYQGEGQMMSFDDVKNYKVGNGIDIGRNVLGMRVESQLWDKAVDNFLDVRSVNTNHYNFVENVARDELTWRINDKLTTKFLGIYHVLPKTTDGIDPYIFDPLTRNYYINDVIEEGKNPSVGTGSLGAEYTFFDWLALNGIWEYTNDLSLGLDNFPRGLLNDRNTGSLYSEYGNQYRQELNFLYDQGYFPKPPYPYHNVFKAGLKVNPIEKMELYLDYARNPFEKAGQVDDNMNHVGLQLSYDPIPKLGLFFHYTYSRWQDLDKLLQGSTKMYSHHNFFGEIIYRKSSDEDLTLQYGEDSRNPYGGGVLDIGWDPYGGSERTIDTPHIIRLYYRRKF